MAQAFILDSFVLFKCFTWVYIEVCTAPVLHVGIMSLDSIPSEVLFLHPISEAALLMAVWKGSARRLAQLATRLQPVESNRFAVYN